MTLMNDEPSASLSDVIASLSRPAAYPFEVDQIEVRQTHISVVFLAGAFVFKIKKPVRLPFLDFSTLDLRHFYCDEEVRLNRRLAEGVYRGVVPIRQTANGLRFAGDVAEDNGPIVEWAVQMERLPDETTFDSRLRLGALTAAQVALLSRRVSRFHQSARRDAETAAFGSFERVAAAIRENIAFAKTQQGVSISTAVFQRLHRATETSLETVRALIDQRVAEGFVRELHGDLHLDHVYLFEDRVPPRDLLVIDCIEFNAGFRCIDVVADMAFCVMDFAAHGRRDLGRLFADEYFAASEDISGRQLLPLFTSYRAAVRAKVNGLLAAEVEVSDADRQAATNRAAGFWLLALESLEPPTRRPALLLVSGLPGTGKSTLARGLSERAGFEVIRSDVVRKELASQSAEANATPATSTAADFGAGLYSSEWTDRTYAECLRRAVAALRNGGRVIVDATFQEDRRRREFLQAAQQLCVPALWLVCEAEAQLTHQRLDARRGDASDADWAIYQAAAARWETPSNEVRHAQRIIDTNGSPADILTTTLKMLTKEELAQTCSAG